VIAGTLLEPRRWLGTEQLNAARHCDVTHGGQI
jgi:hypothetical protein